MSVTKGIYVDIPTWRHVFTCDACNRRVRILAFRESTPRMPHGWRRIDGKHACSRRCFRALGAATTTAARESLTEALKGPHSLPAWALVKK